MRRLPVLLMTFAMVMTQASAFAKDRGEVTAGQHSFDSIWATSEQSEEIRDASLSNSGGTFFTLESPCPSGEGVTGSDAFGCRGAIECGTQGVVYEIWAHHPDGTREYAGSQCVEPGEEPQAAALTESDILRAFRRIPLPESEVSIQPPGGETLVNLDTVFSTEAAGFTRTVGLLGHRVELDIWASEFRWVTGDGKSLLTDWSGRPWRKGASLAELITHRYDDAVKGLRPRVDTTWSARYRVDGGGWRDVPGTVTIEGEPYDLVVRSAEPHLTG